MCNGEDHVYRSCNHRKVKQIWYCAAAQAANDGSGTRRFCPGEGTRIKKVPLDNPSLCPNCYRQHEAALFARYDRDINELRRQIRVAHSDRDLEEAMHKECSNDVVHDTAEAEEEDIRNLGEFVKISMKLEKLEKQLETIKIRKGQTIAAFRDSQGVWGDG